MKPLEIEVNTHPQAVEIHVDRQTRIVGLEIQGEMIGNMPTYEGEDTTHIELTMNHPVYYYKSGRVRPWTDPV